MTDTQNTDTTDATANTDANSGGQQGDGGGEKKVEFSAEQQKHIDKLIGDARKDAARIAAEKAKADQDQKAEDERKQREADEAKAKGDFEKVETTLKSDLQTTKDEVTTLRAENDQFKAAIDAVLKDEWNALEADVLEYYPGTDDDTLARLSWLPKGKALQTKLHPKKGDVLRGNGENPRSSSTTAGDDTTALAMNTRRYG